MLDGETTPPPLLHEADLIALMDKHGIGKYILIICVCVCVAQNTVQAFLGQTSSPEPVQSPIVGVDNVHIFGLSGPTFCGDFAQGKEDRIQNHEGVDAGGGEGGGGKGENLRHNQTEETKQGLFLLFRYGRNSR